MFCLTRLRPGFNHIKRHNVIIARSFCDKQFDKDTFSNEDRVRLLEDKLKSCHNDILEIKQILAQNKQIVKKNSTLSQSYIDDEGIYVFEKDAKYYYLIKFLTDIGFCFLIGFIFWVMCSH